MTDSPLSALSDLVVRLDRALTRLDDEAALLKLPPARTREWCKLLRQKLLPQLKESPFLIVSVLGGTNIGKSVVFNHLAGFRASATSPMAVGTKHPVLLVPEGFPSRYPLAELFAGFQLEAWSDPDKALEETSEHRLFWQTDARLPGNLLILDAPDIDGTATVNWERAEHVRRASDVLLAVLTQQKHNDAAVKRFFKQAARERKTVLVVFNQVLLPEDESYWPRWVQVFCDETGITPERVYLAPADRAAAENLTLPFIPRTWPPESGSGSDENATPDPVNLSEELSTLRFEEIKLATLSGSLSELLHESDGLPGYLRELSSRADEFRSVSRLLEGRINPIDEEGRLIPEAKSTRAWPTAPPPAMREELDRWWMPKLDGFTRGVRTTYDTLTKGVLWPFKKVKEIATGEESDADPWAKYRVHEWEAILTDLERNYQVILDQSITGDPLYRDLFAENLSGKSVAELQAILKAEHEQVHLGHELQAVVTSGMDEFADESSTSFAAHRRMLQAVTAVRPAASVALFLFGFGPASDAVAAPIVDATIGHLMVDVVGGTTVLAGGEVAIEKAGAKVSEYQRIVLELHSRFQARRQAWLWNLLQKHLWGSLPDVLREAGHLPESEAMTEVESIAEALRNAGATSES